MKKSTLFALWGGLFVICAGFGFIAEPKASMKVFLVLLALAFFVPPMILTHRAKAENDRQTLMLIRNLSFLSLVLTVILLIANFLSFAASEVLGNILYALLIVITTPMVCGQYWALSMFLWACMMIACSADLKKK
ncbi:MAG: hypothetical protein IKJ99_08130 [Oscillospiraceae bacterium]|nr:hypothetical protein [Oscillospiraceae bacterium]